MQTLIKQKTITYQDYLKFPNDVKGEIIQGEFTMAVAPNSNHQFIITRLMILLSNSIDKNKSGYLFPAPIDVIFDHETMLEPDIVFVSKEKKEIIQKRGIFGTPDLVIEIISPISQYKDNVIKKEIYEKFGVKEYWLVNPYLKSIEILTLLDNKYQLFSEGFLEDDGNIIVNSKFIPNLETNLTEIFTENF